MQELDWCLRMLLAAFCGGIIGFERKSKAKNAGIRTHALIALGAAMVMIVSKYGFFDLLKITHRNWAVDPSRIAAQVVSGIGFLGAGTIINRRNQQIGGLTTAAGIWVTGAIGLAYGSGLYSIGVIGTACVLLAEILGKYLDQFALRQGREFSCSLKLTGDFINLHTIANQLNHLYFIEPAKYSIDSYGENEIICHLVGRLKAGTKNEDVLSTLTTSTAVKRVEFDQ